jgi:ATP-binding cassette subfamily B protein
MAQDSTDLHALAWPASRLGEAIELMARKAKLLPDSPEAPAPLPELPQSDDAALGQWVEVVTGRLGIEAEPVESSFADVEDMARRAAPAILRLPQTEDDSAAPRFLALLRGGRRLALLGPDSNVRRVRPQVVRDTLCHPLVAPWLEAADQLLTEAGVAETRRERARLALLREQFSSVQVGGGWLLRMSPGASLWQQARHEGLWRPLLALFGAAFIQQGLVVFAWWVIGRGALSGQFEQAWLLAWALVLLTAIPFQLLVAWSQSRFAIGVGALFKQRLLYGALKLEADEIRHLGMGQFLGRVMEAEAVELLALSGGLLALVSIIQLGVAGWVLSNGVGGWPHAGLLFLWVAATLLYSWRYYRHSQAWVETYRSMTNDLVERMVGYRTRLAQEDPRRWHLDEDRDLVHYLELSERLDRTGIGLAALPGSWLAAGLAAIAYSFVAGPASISRVAISLGGVLLAYQALHTVMSGIQSVVQMTMSWGQVKPLFQAAARPGDGQALIPPLPSASGRRVGAYPEWSLPQAKPEGRRGEGVPPSPSPGRGAGGEGPLLLARDLNFRYREHGRLALQGCSLQVYPGDRLLLEGPSGGGKTTLAAVLSGLRVAESGLLLLWGYDRLGLGSEAWRRRVVVAPQFHENHVFTETFGFNLLMGRRWPPTPEDVQEAQTLCHELGLDDLLQRMPSGWQQMVGESGWQLSHGERSRVFIARALLQKADVMIMDESFGALDPENLHRALRCALKRAPTLLVIAHP